MRVIVSFVLFVFGALVLAAAAVALWWAFPPDPVAVLRRERLALADVVREPLPELGARLERWRLIATRGDTLFAMWRPAPPDRAARWTVVLLGGLGTGDRAAALIPDDLTVHVLAVDWPWRGTRQFRPDEFARNVPAMRAAILRSPAVLALGVDAVRREDPNRALGRPPAHVALLGASLGVPPALAALRIAEAPDALLLLDGFAGIEDVLRSDLESMKHPRAQAAALAALAARLIHPLEPARHFDAAANLPTLVMNAEHDERLPRATVQALHDGLPHADHRWRADTHVGPGRALAIAGMALEASAWLDSLPEPAAR
jgi:hypothetical protein